MFDKFTYVHASQLTPDLGEDSNVRTIDQFAVEKLPVGNIFVPGLEGAHLADIVQLVYDVRAVAVTLAVDKSEHVVALLPPVLAGEPTRRLRQEEHSAEEANGRKHLQTPRDAEDGSAVVGAVLTTHERCTIRNAVGTSV